MDWPETEDSIARPGKPVVIITGVTGGIGLATAKLFSSRDWLVVGTVRPGKLNSKHARELAAAAVDLQPAEMVKTADLARVVERTIKTYGRIDALVLNAGYGLWGRLEDLTTAQVKHQMEVNLVAGAELVRLVLPAMRKKRSGTIVALSSLAGRIGLPDAPAYCASKFALEGLMESLWYQMAPDNIKVRLIEPGPVDSPFWRHRVWGNLTRTPRRDWPVLQYSLTSQAVARQVYEVVNSRSNRLRYPLGVVRLVVLVKRILPESIYYRLVTGYYKRKSQNQSTKALQ
jgi:short-subunit dehydrogenase